MSCRICGGSTRVTHTATVLGRHEATYRMCDTCEFWFVVDAHWLDEAYSRPIASTDTGLVARNLSTRDMLTSVFTYPFDPTGTFVDWAGGYGLLVRLMRDRGFDMRWQDAYTENLFAVGHEWSDGSRPAEAVTAIEVLEHLADPVGFFDEVTTATGTDSVIASQELHHGVDTDWWYLAQETGQHIAFYSARTMSALAERVGMTYHQGDVLHLFTRRRIPEGRFARRAAPPGRLRRLRGFKHPASLAPADYASAVETVKRTQ